MVLVGTIKMRNFWLLYSVTRRRWILKRHNRNMSNVKSCFIKNSALKKEGGWGFRINIRNYFSHSVHIRNPEHLAGNTIEKLTHVFSYPAYEQEYFIIPSVGLSLLSLQIKLWFEKIIWFIFLAKWTNIMTLIQWGLQKL